MFKHPGLRNYSCWVKPGVIKTFTFSGVNYLKEHETPRHMGFGLQTSKEDLKTREIDWMDTPTFVKVKQWYLFYKNKQFVSIQCEISMIYKVLIYLNSFINTRFSSRRIYFRFRVWNNMYVGKYLSLFQHTALGTTPLWHPLPKGQRTLGFLSYLALQRGGIAEGVIHAFNVFCLKFFNLTKVGPQSPGFCWVGLWGP